MTNLFNKDNDIVLFDLVMHIIMYNYNNQCNSFCSGVIIMPSQESLVASTELVIRSRNSFEKPG